MKFKERIEAKSKEKALEEAVQIFREEVEDEFGREDISLNLIEEKKGFLGVFGGCKVYSAVLEIEEDEGEDGEFELSVRDDGIFLTVFQPEGNGREVRLSEIEEAIGRKEIIEVDYGAVSEALTANEEKIKIAERRPELDRDAEIDVEISRDGLKAYLDYEPPLGGKEYTAEEILRKIKEEAGVVFGIKEEEFKEEFEPEKKLEDFLIAEGNEVVPGSDGEIEFNFDLERKERKVNLKEDGTADFHNLGRIINVKPGEVLAEKVPPEEGTSGKKVTGADIAPDPVREAKFPAGENVKVSEDGEELIAEIEGQVVYTNEQISVLDVHQVDGSVDLSTGNIDFNGNVIIKEDVEEGMEVKADGNVTVGGSVYKADIKAEGQVVVKKGLIGGNKGSIEAGGDVEVKFVENGRIKTQGSLKVIDAIMHSNVDAQEEVILNRGKGLIVGGEVRAGKEIEAQVVGSNLATPTEVSVGVTPQLRDKHNRIKNQLETKQSKLEETIKNINQLKKKEATGEIKKRREQLLNQLIKQRFSLAKEIEDLKDKEHELNKSLKESCEAKIKVRNTIYSGVRVTVGNSTTKIDKENSYVIFYEEDGEIRTTSFG